MTNEYGVKLDRNGYAPSIMQEDLTRCYLCGACDQKLDRHEPFNGPLRGKSKYFGMWVMLCSERCHHGDVHKHFQTAKKLKEDAQRAAMNEYGWNTNDFIIEFGKNWL